MDSDLALALKLQAEFDSELAKDIDKDRHNSENVAVNPSRPLSIVDESWELTDPNPDIRMLFLQYNDQFFWGKLAGVEVKWSPRMTLCAGICCYEGRGGLCSIRLSKPLLQLRPRKDLVETLLHEMIHALLFVTQNNKDHDGHGPEFQKHMYRINNQTGTNITIYHNFHDEVAHFQQHWWRCNGPCQNRKPYFGYVKRAMNRAPSPKDFWWAEHQRSCGGTYTKIKEPEGYGQKKKNKDEKNEKKNEKQKNGNMDIRIFAGKGFALNSGSGAKTDSGIDSEKIVRVGGKLKKPAATVTKSEADVGSEGLGDVDIPLLKRISQDGRSDVTGTGSVSQDVDGTVIKKRPSDPSLPSLSTRVSDSPKKNDQGDDVDRRNKGDQRFPGNGYSLGSSSSVGKGVLAMLRKKWAEEKAREGTVNVSSDSLTIPGSSKGHRKRNSDELRNSEFDFKKLKTETESTMTKVFSQCDDKQNVSGISGKLISRSDSSRSDQSSVVVLDDEHGNKSMKPCPVCQTQVELSYINEHLDRCLAE